MSKVIETHQLPLLSYDFAALEPCIDARTMRLHFAQHHASYVKALNQTLQSAPALLHDKPADWLLLNPEKIPETIRTTVRNNAGGHLNHSLLWRAMSPAGAGGGGSTPSGPLADAIDESFGSFEKFKAQFEEAGSKQFGSGWVWLVSAPDGAAKLQVMTTSGHDNPIAEGYFPVLVNDVWEHAYYLQHENRRPDYLKGWWPVVNWTEAALRFARSPMLAEPPADVAYHGVLEIHPRERVSLRASAYRSGDSPGLV